MKMAAEEMLMIRPLRCCRIWGTTALLASHTPRTLTAISSSHSAWPISQKGFIVMVEKIAALLTRTSRRPNWRTVVATISRQLVSSATSVRTKMACPPAARHSSATAFPFASFSSATTTRAPSSTSRCAYARPIPWPAPVTTATRSSSFIVSAPGAETMKLEDRVAVVTGAGQGIGRAYAHRLVEEGARVVVAELNEAKGKAVAEECLAAGGQAIFVRTDVADETSCREMVATTVRQFGRLDVLVNNAAIFSTITMKPFWEIGQAEWDELMAVNVRG